MRRLIILVAILSIAAQGVRAAREATSTINNFTTSGGVYSFDVLARSTGADPIFVGSSSLFFNYNSAGLSTPTLTNINSKYTGTSNLFEGYDEMTGAIIGGQIGVTIIRDFGAPQILNPTDELICTVNLTVTDPNELANVSWNTGNSAITDAQFQPVTNTFVGSDTGPLPIQLASLTATVVNQNEVRVDWTTLTETNNYGFEVQKSAETTSDYQTIPNSFVPGHGTTVQPHSYSYTDVTASSGLWFYRLKQIDLDGTVHYTEGVQVDVTTGVEEKLIPTVFGLDQNYPNPFNPSTVIEFAIPQETHVKLEVYNMIGQRVATLVDGVRPAGYYSVLFDATGLASGVYVYRFEAENPSAGSGQRFIETKKLVFLK